MTMRFRDRGEKKPTLLARIKMFQGKMLRIGIFLLTAVLSFFIIWGPSVRELRSLQVGDISQTTEYATRTIVDRYTTLAEKEKAYKNVIATDKRYFEIDTTIRDDALEEISECFTSMRTVIALGQDWRNGTPNQLIWGVPAPSSPEEEFSDVLVATVASILAGNFTDAEIRDILHAKAADITRLEDVCTQLVDQEMEDSIPNTDNALSARLNTVYSRIEQESTLTSALKSLGKTVVSQYMVENRFYNQEATLAAAQAAADAVPDTKVREGQLIISQGEMVTERQLVLLTDMGLIQNESNSLLLVMGIALVVALVLGICLMYMLVYQRELTDNTNNVLMLCIALVVVLAICALLQDFNIYLPPVTLMAMWAVYMTDQRTASLMGTAASVLCGVLVTDAGNIISVESFSVVAANFLASVAAVLAMRKVTARGGILRAGFIGGLVSATFLVAVQLMINGAPETILTVALMGFSGNLLAAIACLGTMPLFETVFHLITPMKYMELSNPNQPLLKQLLLEAPGTYQHSIVVGNLAETAAVAVGADPMLARAGACYHDIGKLKRPYFFKENHIGRENPHDDISAELSTRIIINHVSDGVELARKHRLPPQVIDCITQHHGDTVAGYFYAKAKKEAEDPESIRDEDYRYPGTRPVSKECAILMMADSVEAAARTLVKPTREALEELVVRICQGKLNDGQLDLSDLTLGEIDRVQQEFVKSLSAIYHERIEYPTLPTRR